MSCFLLKKSKENPLGTSHKSILCAEFKHDVAEKRDSAKEEGKVEINYISLPHQLHTSVNQHRISWKCLAVIENKM